MPYGGLIETPLIETILIKGYIWRNVGGKVFRMESEVRENAIVNNLSEFPYTFVFDSEKIVFV